MFILKRIALPGAILILTHAICGLSSADEKPQPAEVQVVALDGNAITFTAEQLRTLPRISVEVADRTGKMVKYSGVAIQHLVIHENARLGEELRGEALRCDVSVPAKDEYRVVFAWCEFDAIFSDRTILLADEQDGKPLNEETGPFQVIVPGEKRRARWVRQVNRIRLMESRVVDEDMPISAE